MSIVAEAAVRNMGQGLFAANISSQGVTGRNRNATSTAIKCQVLIERAGFHHLSMTSQSWPQKLQLQPPSLSFVVDFL